MMFTRLRNRFLLVNLATISVLMLIAFAAIYTITYRNVQNDISMELHRILDTQKKNPHDVRQPNAAAPGGLPGSGQPSSDGSLTGQPGVGRPGVGSGLPPERSVSFVLLTSPAGELTVRSQLSLDASVYREAQQTAEAAKRESGRAVLDGSPWAYLVQQTAEGELIAFTNISTQRKFLLSLIYTFAAVAAVMLVVLYFVSRYFANRSIRPVREAFDKQRQFIADASHELKTPLAVINTNSDVLLAHADDTIASQAKWLQYIKSETTRMAKLTNDLLYLTEMDDVRPRVLFSRFNLSEAVETALLPMEAVIYERELALEYEIEPGLTVFGSGEQITQVAMILLDNAVKYANPRGRIALSLHKQHGAAVLAVTNTGEGIAPEHLPRVFDRFYRTDASRSRKQGGYGLGLAIARSIVEQHKGRIAVKSVPGESTTFSVQLPLA